MQPNGLTWIAASATALAALSSAPAGADPLAAGYGGLGGLISGAVGGYPGPPRYWCGQRWWTGMPVTEPSYATCNIPPAVVFVYSPAPPVLVDEVRSRRVVVRRKY